MARSAGQCCVWGGNVGMDGSGVGGASGTNEALGGNRED
jgi:hypothetical protein